MRVPRKLPQACGVAFMLLLAATGQTAAQTSRPDALAAIQIGNFGQVNASFYRGEQPEGRDYAALATLGVKTVIDLQRDFDAAEQRLVERAGMKFVRIPMTTSDRPADADVERFLALVNDPANQPVYVHCKGGRHRTGVMTAAYRMTHDGWSAEQAYEEMKDYKFKMPLNFLFGHDELKEFVFDYYATMQQNGSIAPANGGR
jgi:protein tyrosine/serine phosphatase